MSLVTLSATYGAGGSEVGPELAKRLGVPFVDRLITLRVAARLAVSRASACAHDGVSAGVLARALATLAPIGQAFGEAPATAPVGDRDFREATEQVIFERAESGHGVILGRAAAVVLRDDPLALHVRLDGSREGAPTAGNAAAGDRPSCGRAAHAGNRPRTPRLRAPLPQSRRTRPRPLPPSDQLHRDRPHRVRRGDRARGRGSREGTPRKRLVENVSALISRGGPGVVG